MIWTRRALWVLMLLVVSLASGSVFAQEAPAAPKWDAFPEIKKHQKVGIKARYDSPQYNEFRKCIRRFKSKKGAQYFAALVDITDISGKKGRKRNDAQPYAKALFEDLVKTRGVSASKGIVIVTGIQNRSVGVYAGTKWQKLGLDDQAIRDAMAASDFLHWVKRYDVGQGVCSVATAVDFKLVNLERDLKRRVESAKKELPGVESKLAEVQKAVNEAFPDGHTYGDGLKGELAVAVKSVADAKEKLEDQPSDAVVLFDKARETIGSVGERLTAYQASMEELSGIEKAVTDLQASVAARDDVDWEFPMAAAKTLTECAGMAEKIRDSYEGKASEVQDCLRRAETDLAKGDVHYHYKATEIPEKITVVVVITILVLIVALFLRRRNALGILDPDLKEWQRQLGVAERQLQEVSDTYGSYLTERDAWQGAAGELDAATISNLNRAFLLERAGKDLFTRGVKP